MYINRRLLAVCKSETVTFKSVWAVNTFSKQMSICQRLWLTVRVCSILITASEKLKTAFWLTGV